MKMDKLFWERLVAFVLVFFANPVLIGAANGEFPGLFSFGDSILDTGNNNYLWTTSKCNFPPYGRNFYGGRATGRWNDGKVPSDLIAGALGIKETLPASLDPNLSTQDLLTGVSFASGGSGLDIQTSAPQGVLSMAAQLQLFRDYIGKVRGLVGEQQTSFIISKSLYLISAGNNDIALWNTPPRIFQPLPQYTDTLVGWASDFFKSLYQLGARRVWVLSTLPLGCLPGARTTTGGPLRLCAPIVNQEAQLFNTKLSSAVSSIKTNFPDYDIRFIDVYTPLLDLIENPSKAGIVNVQNGCCGTGTFEVGAQCNLVVGSCPNPSQYAFWDIAHPTERAYQFVVSSILQSNNVSSSLS